MREDLRTLLVHDLRLPAARLTPDTTLSDAGLDSLAVVELSVLLEERYAIRLTEVELEQAPTLGDLDTLITRAQTEG
ncbi:hypothetical protein GCM10010329_86110 [Streptomyces spiroverticillatus]|uniref:Carrier domain-containing protein n=1 Tax=Streptomyces finlayi TaxID=67296 RepID=A0A919CGY9_9ACTN|nr:acyl carrier protein [Streptomyces finlayi]GHA50926.1 hypothetical protein GCM10010329_86110 [Streptomyces spiroverticillatus]GHD20027.1 hypothetical protein GCM10010334_84170 [Streptomyces finlayi]